MLDSSDIMLYIISQSCFVWSAVQQQKQNPENI